MSEAKELLIEIMRDDCLATADRLRAVEFLAALYPETFKPEPPAPIPTDNPRLFDMLVEAYMDGWHANVPPTKYKSPFWDAGATRAVKRLLERYKNA